MEELKRCPFCGNKPILSTWIDESLYSHDEVSYYQVVCYSCDAQTSSSEDKQEAIGAWNKRV